MTITTPTLDTRTANDLLTLAINKAVEVSKGKLTRLDSSSPVVAILEAIATVAAIQQTNINALPDAIQSSQIAIFGISRQIGAQAVGTVTVTLDALYNTPFVLPKGFKLSLSGVAFQTTDDLTIPSYVASGNVGIVAINAGSSGNLPTTATATFSDVQRLASITLIQPTKGGLDEEPLDAWKQRVYATIRRRDTLISESDFQDEVRSFLGVGSVALAIGKLKPDKISYANGYVGVFGLNPDGSVLTDAQISALQSDLSTKAAMATVTLWSLTIVPINVSVVAGFLPGSSPDSLSAVIQQTVTDYLSPGTLPAGAPILPKALERRIQGIRGMTEGVISVELNGLAQPAALPSRWSVGKLGTLAIALISSSGQQFLYNF